MEHSEHVEDHAQELLNKLSKLTDRPLKGHFTFWQEKFNHRVSLTLVGKNTYLKSDATNENFYAAIEGAVDKVQRQLQKKKTKLKHHKQKHPAKELNNIIFLDEYKRTMEKRKSG
jgi:putative sigma-54 modulation protein